MADAPAEVKYGKVEGFFTRIGADTVADGGNVPDEYLLSGSLTLTPSVRKIKIAGSSPPRDSLLDTVTAKVIDGYIVPPDATDSSVKGVYVAATNQTDTSPATIYWTAKFIGGVSAFGTLSGLTVPVDGTLSLNTVVPTDPEPGVVYVTYDASMGLNLVEDPEDEGTFIIGEPS